MFTSDLQGLTEVTYLIGDQENASAGDTGVLKQLNGHSQRGCQATPG